MFGGFGNDFFDAYHRVIPKAEPYYQERQDMYEAYHHLNHFVMFGGGYRSGTVRIFKKLIAWADKVGGSSAAGGGDEQGGGGGSNDSSSGGGGGLKGGNSALQSAIAALPGCSSSAPSQKNSQDPPADGGAGAAEAVASTSATTLDSAMAPLHQSAFPPATPSQIADYFSQMICYLWFSSGVPGHSMPSTPSRSPVSKHVPLQSSPLAPRRLPANSFAGPLSTRSFRPTHTKTSSTGNLYQAGPSTAVLSPDLSRDVQGEDPYSNPAAATSKLMGNDPMLRRLQPKSRFLRFCREVLSTTQVSTSVITLALIYVHRLKAAHPHLKGRDGSEFRLAISSLMLANKILDDNTYLNKTWAEISGMPLIEISKMEVEFWLGLKMELHIGKEDYDRGLNEIQMLANDRNRAVIQRDAAVKRALQQQQQAMAQSSQWMPYMQHGLSISSDGLTGPYESRFSSPLPPLSGQPPVRRSMGNFDAMNSLDTPSHVLPYQVPAPSYDFGAAMQDYSIETPPYYGRPSTFTLPPSPLSQASAGVASTQQDGTQSGFAPGPLLHDAIASSPNHRSSLPFAFNGDQWAMWNQSSTSAADTTTMQHGSTRSYDVSPTNTSLTSLHSYAYPSRPSLSTQSTSTLAGLKRDFEKTNIDASSPMGGQASSKRFAAEPSIAEDLQHYRLSSSSKQSSQSPTESRYMLRSRSRNRAAITPSVLARGAGRSSASAASPIYPTSTASAMPSPASQRSFQLPRPQSAHNDMSYHQPHPNYHSVFTSALTPTALAAPLDNLSMDLYQPWSGSQGGVKKVTPLHYYSLAAGEPFGNIGSYLPMSSTMKGFGEGVSARRSSMLSEARRDSSHALGSREASANGWSQQGAQPQTPLSAPSFASGYTVQAKDGTLGSSSTTSMRGIPPFSLDVHSWPLTNTASSSLLLPYHQLPPPQPYARPYPQQSHVS